MKYLIEVFDPKTECIVEEMGFEVDQTEELLSILGLESFNPHSIYELDTNEIQRINARYQLNIDSGATLVKLSFRSALDDLPYKDRKSVV